MYVVDFLNFNLMLFEIFSFIYCLRVNAKAHSGLLLCKCFISALEKYKATFFLLQNPKTNSNAYGRKVLLKAPDEVKSGGHVTKK